MYWFILGDGEQCQGHSVDIEITAPIQGIYVASVWICYALLLALLMHMAFMKTVHFTGQEANSIRVHCWSNATLTRKIGKDERNNLRYPSGINLKVGSTAFSVGCYMVAALATVFATVLEAGTSLRLQVLCGCFSFFEQFWWQHLNRLASLGLRGQYISLGLGHPGFYFSKIWWAFFVLISECSFHCFSFLCAWILFSVDLLFLFLCDVMEYPCGVKCYVEIILVFL